VNDWAQPRLHGDQPSGRHIVCFLASRPEFAGIGRATAQKLWNTFREELYRLLANGDVDRLAALLPRTQAEIVCDAWRNQQALADAVVFFDEIGIDNRLARKAIDFWGNEAVSKLRENPYRLLTICSWTQVDRFASLLGFPQDDLRRLVGAVETALYDRLDEKHTATPQEEVIRRVKRLLGASPETAARALAAAVDEGAALPSPAGYQPAGAAYIERYIESRFRASLEGSQRQLDLPLGPGAKTDFQKVLDKFLASYNARAAHCLTQEQEAAVRMVMSRRVSILTGGAGVGKTTCLRAINEVARTFGLHVWQLALAGRAAQRVADSTGQPAQTIASWLLDAAKGRARCGPHTLIIVDEASMLDLPTLYRLLFHFHEDTRLLLVGDVAQLPPIGFGLTLHRLVQSSEIPQVELTRVLRADETTGIPLVSRAVSDGNMPSLLPYEVGMLGCSFVASRQEDIIGAIERICDDLHGEDVQIIGATYAGRAGIDAINTYFHRYNAHARPRLLRFAVGDPVIWTKNDYERGLWNGSIGLVVAVEGARLTVRFDGEAFDLCGDELKDLDLAYAISCHKAQGSEWGSVIVPIVPSRLLDRALLYTALTRAKQRAILIGDYALLERTVICPPVSLSRDVALCI
jgi:exodeoxyribonuclease V alpha subunit